jgi:hypothetical protein
MGVLRVPSTACSAVYPVVTIESRIIDSQKPFETDLTELAWIER